KLASAPGFEADAPLTDWADGPGAAPANDVAADAGPAATYFDGILDGADGLPVPSFGLGDDDDEEEDEEPSRGPQFGSLLKMPLQLSPKPRELDDAIFEAAFTERESLLPSAPLPQAYGAFVPEEADTAIAPPALDPEQMNLGDWLASA